MRDEYKLVKDAEGNPLEILGYWIDITGHKIAEQALKENENRLHTILSSNPDPIVVYDNNGHPQYVNPSFTESLGWSLDELKGSTIPFVPESEKAATDKSIMALIKGKSVVRLETKRLTREGKILEMLVSAAPFIGADGAMIGSVVCMTDVSKVMALERQFQLAYKIEALGTLAGGIAHDFNNILSSIIGFTELSIDEVTKGSQMEDNLQEVYVAGKRAKDLVKQILAFARQSDEKLTPIQVDIIAKETLKLIRSTIPTTIEIKTNIESHSLIMGNTSQIHQIFMNLLTNASCAMEAEGGILTVEMTDVKHNPQSRLTSEGLRYGTYMKITISDTGSGISPEIMDSIFEPYFTTKGPGEGTGMGLATVNGIVESYGGKITADSQLGIGSTFTVYLPLAKMQADFPEYIPEQLPSGSEHILFVDDEAPIAKMGARNLESLGYRVTTRTSSVEALELFKSKPTDFDLIVTDMTMPNLTGDNLAIELLKIRPDIPVILCTGYTTKISEEDALEIGVKAFVYKPIVKSDLAKTIRKVLGEAKS